MVAGAMRGQFAEKVRKRARGTCRRVLVVDDSASQRRVLRAYLSRWGYDVTEAASGGEALALSRDQDFDVIISDWMMPGMDGLALCGAVRALPNKPYSYFMLLTSKSDKVDIARGLDMGADDFVSKPVASDELTARIRAGERILAMERELREKNRMVTQALAQISELYDALDRDLIEARNLQQALVRERWRDFGAGRVSLLLQPSGHIGGDLVGFFEVSQDQIGVYAIDVSGHGVASALLTARLAAELSGATPERNIALCTDAAGRTVMREPAEIADRLNDLFLNEIQAEQYFTMALAQICLKTGQVRMAHCGDPGALIQHADGRVTRQGHPGFPIGIVAAAHWETTDFLLAPGSRLLMVSDGVTEALSPEGDQLQTGGLERLLTKNGELSGTALLDALVWDISAWSGDNDFDDDISALLFEFTGA